jgi:hypothetical protein
MKEENNVKKEILERTAKEYFQSANDEFKKTRFNSAVDLFFKSLIALGDLFIIQNISITPSSHGERFRIVQENFPEVYKLLDKDFPFYQDSYSILMSKELAGVIETDVKILAEKTKVKL